MERVIHSDLVDLRVGMIIVDSSFRNGGHGAARAGGEQPDQFFKCHSGQGIDHDCKYGRSFQDHAVDFGRFDQSRKGDEKQGCKAVDQRNSWVVRIGSDQFQYDPQYDQDFEYAKT